MRRTPVLFLGLVLVQSAGCQTMESVEAEPVTEVALDPEDDEVNELVQENSIPAVIVRLEISPAGVAMTRARVTRIPRSHTQFDIDDSQIVVKALNRLDDVVGQTSAADRRVNVRESEGEGEVVFIENRSVSIAVPLIGKPRELGINLPGEPPDRQFRFSINDAVNEYCGRQPSDDVCDDGPIVRNAMFEFLNPPDD